MGDVSEKFLTPMLVFFSLPNSAHADRETFLSGYVDELSEYTSHELEHAAKLLRTTRTTRTLPTIADCLEACKQARDTLQAPAKRRHGSDAEKYPDWAPGRQRMADRMMNSDFGRQAADEDWIGALWDFCRKNERLPNKFEVDGIRSESRKNWKAIEEMIEQMAETARSAKNKDLRDKYFDDVRKMRNAVRDRHKKAEKLKKIAYNKQEAA